jgi:peptidoglycan/LPS O-acetylase OafA/YrhL
MGTLLFVFGSAAGAVLAWFVGRREPSRATVAAINGVVGFLLGMVLSASYETATPATEAAIGLLGNAVPLTLCMGPLDPTASSSRICFAVGRMAGGLALALVCGLSCATLGFVAVEAVRYIGVKGHGA